MADNEKRQAVIDLLDNNPVAIEDMQNGDSEAVEFTVQGRLNSHEIELVSQIVESEEMMANVLDQACGRTLENDRSNGIKF